MELVLSELEHGIEKSISALKKFNTQNSTNFSLGETSEARKKFCASLLSLLPSAGATIPSTMSSELHIEVLTALRIASREQYGITELTTEYSVKKLLSLAGLVGDVKKAFTEISYDNLSMQVALESLKCLSNVTLKNESSAVACGKLGADKALLDRTKLWDTTVIPHDVKFFDMRLLFILTAVCTKVRTVIRDEYNGFTKMVALVDYVMFGSSEGPAPQQATNSTAAATPVAQLTCRENSYTIVVKKDTATLLAEMMKTIFNITLNWCEKEDDLNKEDLHTFKCFTHLLRILLLSVSPYQGVGERQLLSHCIDTMMNLPLSCSSFLVLPPEVKVDTILPYHLDASTVKSLYSQTLDKIYNDHNVAVIVALLNFLYMKLTVEEMSSHLMPVVAVLRITAAGNRNIRKFLRQEILPPIGKVAARPDIGSSLKSRLVKLMTGTAGGVETIVADLLYILCKENPNRLVKHTGYGNAAGLLMSRGMLGGRTQPQEFVYSDDEDSDTEEYLQSCIDPVTGGPAKTPEPSPLDSMTEEAKEVEAEKLMGLIDQLNRHGVVRMLPVDKHGSPLNTANDTKEESDDSDN
ncbi:synembryn-A-like [Dysidea avara]|uniref:synembryn-A-like n=1 Tax=Dysidea avara TaxID=196820 RepID=UPI00331F13B0